MYLNHKTILKKGLSANDILLLDCINQQTSDNNMEEYIINYTEGNSDFGLIERGFATTIKGTPKQSSLHKLRLTKKGKDLLKLIQEADVEEQDKLFSEWLVKLYKNKGKTIKSSKKLLRLIAWFRTSTGIEKNKLGALLKEFIALQEETDFKYSHDVNNIFWRPENIFQAKPSLENSRLYSFYMSDKERFDKIFEKY